MDPLDIAFGPGALGRVAGPGGVRVAWLGTAGFAIEFDGHVVLIDPYVTRASLLRLAGHVRPDEEAIARYVPRADAIVVGHTHFDHALDVPAIARRTGARVFGSRSSAALCRSRGIPDEQIDIVERPSGSAPVDREVGPFALRFVPSAHSRFMLGRVPAPGEIADCGDVPMRVGDYRCGAVFGVEIRVGGRTLYHVGSAEIVDANVPKASVDLLLMCVAGWTSSHEFPERVMHRFAPGAVLLSHWDNFFRPMGKLARPLPAMQMPRLVDRLSRAAGSAAGAVRIGTVPILGEVWI
jgi:L-ascorbate metabolism protein UlaG (beta-lactamase superfamily)